MKNIKVSNCQECPFCNNDNEHGFNMCNLDRDIYGSGFIEMPEDSVHENCPLLKNKVSVELV